MNNYFVIYIVITPTIDNTAYTKQDWLIKPW